MVRLVVLFARQRLSLFRSGGKPLERAFRDDVVVRFFRYEFVLQDRQEPFAELLLFRRVIRIEVDHLAAAGKELLRAEDVAGETLQIVLHAPVHKVAGQIGEAQFVTPLEDLGIRFRDAPDRPDGIVAAPDDDCVGHFRQIVNVSTSEEGAFTR